MGLGGVIGAGAPWSARRGALRGQQAQLPQHDKAGYDVDPDTAWVVQRIFAEALAGRPIRAIARGLTSDGIPSPRGRDRWLPSAVWAVLHEPKYKGEGYNFVHRFERVKGRKNPKQSVRPRGEWQPVRRGAVPPLVSPADWDRVQGQLERNVQAASRNNPAPEDTLLRAGLAKCGHCGHNLYVKRLKDGAYYCCQTAARDPAACRYHSIKAEALDRGVWAYVEHVRAHPDAIAANLERTRAGDPTLPDLGLLERRIGEARRKRENLVKGVAGEDDDDVRALLQAELKRRTAELRQLEEDRAALVAQREAREAEQAHLEQLAADFQAATDQAAAWGYDEKRRFLEGLEATAYVYRQEPGRAARWEVTLALTAGDLPFDVVIPAGTTWTAPPFRTNPEGQLRFGSARC